MAGSVKLSETRRVYRFQLDDARETRDLLAEAKEKVGNQGDKEHPKDKDYSSAIEDLLKARNLVHEEQELKDEVNLYLHEVQTLREVAEEEARAAALREEAERMFTQIDLDGDGTLNLEELKELARQLGVELTERAAHSAFLEVDTDGNSEIDFEEFFVFFLANRDKDTGGLRAGFTSFFGGVAWRFKQEAAERAANKAHEGIDPTADSGDKAQGLRKSQKSKKKKKGLKSVTSGDVRSMDAGEEDVVDPTAVLPDDELPSRKGKKKSSSFSKKGLKSGHVWRFRCPLGRLC